MMRSVRPLIFTVIDSYGLFILTESQLREKLQKWLSPFDPSLNQNIARKAHHKGISMAWANEDPVTRLRQMA
jgi:hypothetical protein